MEPKRLNSECIDCLLKKYLNVFQENTDEDKKIEYMQKLLRIISEAPMSVGAPEIVDDISKLQKNVLGFVTDYTEEKKYFNQLMLELEPDIRKELSSAEDSLKLAVCFAAIGNYIDFGAMKNVDAEQLKGFLKKAGELRLDESEMLYLKSDLEKAKNLVFLTDNCGEIVLDKLLLTVIKEKYPQISAEVIVRGEPVLNDATTEDAKQVGLDELFNVTPNGSSVAGTCLNRVSAETRARLEAADVIIAKGQGNFETLRHCEKNVYYIFMCKCKAFADRFGVARFSGMLVNDLRLGKFV